MEIGLVERARGGDAIAFESLIEQRMDMIYRLCLAITGDPGDAEDASQDAVMAVWRGLAKLRQADHFDAWFQRVVVNAARMRLRTRRRMREVPDLEIRPDQARLESGADEAMAVDEAMRRLTTDQRTLLALHHLQGRGVDEISEILGIRAGTVKSRLYAARQALATALAAGE